MELFKTSEKQYVWIFATVALGLFISSKINSLLLLKFKSQQIIGVALVMQSLTGVVLFAGSAYGWLGLGGTIVSYCVFLSCQGFTFPNSSALSMAPFSKNAGSASALMGGVQRGMGAFNSVLISIFSNGTALPMTGVMLSCSVTSLITLLIGRKAIQYKASITEIEEDALEMLSTS